MLHFLGQNVHNRNGQLNLSILDVLGTEKLSLIERCPHCRSQNVHNPYVLLWNFSILDTLRTEEVSLT